MFENLKKSLIGAKKKLLYCWQADSCPCKHVDWKNCPAVGRIKDGAKMLFTPMEVDGKITNLWELAPKYDIERAIGIERIEHEKANSLPTPQLKTERKSKAERLMEHEKMTRIDQEQFILKKLEEGVKEKFLSTPKTHRLTETHSYQPPAERHRDAISKAMKGKGGSQRYRKIIKQSPKVKIEEEED